MFRLHKIINVLLNVYFTFVLMYLMHYTISTSVFLINTINYSRLSTPSRTTALVVYQPTYNHSSVLSDIFHILLLLLLPFPVDSIIKLYTRLYRDRITFNKIPNLCQYSRKRSGIAGVMHACDKVHFQCLICLEDVNNIYTWCVNKNIHLSGACFDCLYLYAGKSDDYIQCLFNCE